MSVPTLSCPECQKSLKLSRPLAPGKRLVCPKCGHRFVPEHGNGEVPGAPADEPFVGLADSPPLPRDPAPPAEIPAGPPADFRKPVLIAAAGAVVFIGLSIAAAVWFTRTSTHTPVVENPNQDTTQALPAPPTPKQPPAEDPKEIARKEEEKRKGDFNKLMVEGNAALADQKYDDAIKAYSEALKLSPQDVNAAQGLNAARTAQTALSKEKTETDKRKAEFARLMDEGKKAVADKQLLQAVRAFESALQIEPTDPAAKKALEDVRQALAQDEDQKKKLVEYEKYIKAGRAALVAQRYADAIREYQAALRVMPDDKEALDGWRQAEKRIGEEQNEEKRRTSFNQAVAIAAAALKAKRYEEAVQGYELALKLYPGDKEAKQGLDQAKQALAAAAAQLNGLMAQAQAAAGLGRWEEAVRIYNEAARLFPNNNTVIQSLRNAEKMLLDIQAAQSAYLRWMNQGALAFNSKRWDEAVRCYAEAVRLFPNDREAALRLREAQVYLDRELKNRPLYNKAMQLAVGSYKQGRYLDAARYYGEALALFPDDPQAQAGLRQARYAQYMTDGEAAMRAKRYLDAVRDFENALREAPGDPAATKALYQARQLALKK